MSEHVRRFLPAAVGVAVAFYIFDQIEMDPFMAFIIVVLGLAAWLLADTKASVWIGVAILVWAIVLPLFHDSGQGFIDDANIMLAYVVMALGLNIVVGFAGLLDLGDPVVDAYTRHVTPS